MVVRAWIAGIFVTLLPCSQGRCVSESPVRISSPFLSPLSLNLSVVNWPGSRSDLDLRVMLTNRSSKPVTVDRFLRFQGTLWVEVRDSKGRKNFRLAGPVVQTPLGASDYSSLAPGQSVTSAYHWSSHFREVLLSDGITRIRALYSTGYARPFSVSTGHPLLSIKLLSNTVLVRRAENSVKVVGSGYYTEPDVKLSSLIPGRTLRKVHANSGSRQAQMPELVLGGERIPRVVQQPKDLEGHLDIKSEAQALEFVRLFTGAGTHFMFPEFRAVEAFTRRHAPDEVYGEVNQYRWDDLGLKSTSTARDGGGYVVRRNLIRYPERFGGLASLVTVVEHVSPSGGYKQAITRVVERYKLFKDAWSTLPYYSVAAVK